jgi:hypothetical protein
MVLFMDHVFLDPGQWYLRTDRLDVLTAVDNAIT